MNMLGLKIKPKQFMDIEIFVWEAAAPLDSSATTAQIPLLLYNIYHCEYIEI